MIQQEISNANFNVDILANKMTVSRSVLYRKIKAITNVSPAEFIRSYRLRQAKNMLQQHTNLSVAEVAFELGFNDPKYFSKCFKKEYGKTPRQLIEQIKN